MFGVLSVSAEKNPGRLETLIGSMFAGKSEELIRLLRRAVIAKKTVHVFKPSIDTRDGTDRVMSHSRIEIPATPIDQDHPETILHTNTEWNRTLNPTCPADPIEGWVWDADVVGIDEAQFFAPGIVNVVDMLVKMGKRVIIAGLGLDYRGEPMGSMPLLTVKADHIIHLTAVCTICGQPAIRTQRLVPSEAYVEIGGADKYAARCRLHFNPDPNSHE